MWQRQAAAAEAPMQCFMCGAIGCDCETEEVYSTSANTSPQLQALLEPFAMEAQASTTCLTYTFINSPEASACAMCGTALAPAAACTDLGSLERQGDGEGWTCQNCTYHNPTSSGVQCEVCEAERGVNGKLSPRSDSLVLPYLFACCLSLSSLLLRSEGSVACGMQGRIDT